jgi:hypothetical protein
LKKAAQKLFLVWACGVGTARALKKEALPYLLQTKRAPEERSLCSFATPKT